MLGKERLEDNGRMRVTFELPSTLWACSVAVVGDFNDWDPQRHLMHQRRDGTWTVTIELVTGRSYEFRYLIDGEQSTTEWSADGLASHCGTTNSIITL